MQLEDTSISGEMQSIKIASSLVLLPFKTEFQLLKAFSAWQRELVLSFVPTLQLFDNILDASFYCCIL